jgi:hypothetical protein
MNTKNILHHQLRSAFEEDKQLFNHNNTSWVKSVFQIKNLFNLPSLDISYSDFLEKIKLTYINKIENVFHFQLG